MLTVPLEKLAFIIIKAREYDAEDAEVDTDSGSNPSDDGAADILEDNPDNSTGQELRDAIDGLSEPERIELLALAWLGRGDYAKEDWRQALRDAVAADDERETGYLVGLPLLASHLEEGLSQLGYSIEDYEIDRL